MDGDGLADIVTGLGGVGIVVQLSLGNFTFKTTGAPIVTPLLSAARLGDVDGDGALDLVGTTNDASGLAFVVFRGDGHGGLGPPLKTGVSVSTASSLGPIGVADFDGDGRADVAAIAGAWISGTFVVLRGQADGSLGPPTLFHHPSPWQLAAADVNGDHVTDLVVGVPLQVFLGGPSGLVPPIPSGSTDLAPFLSLAAGDLDGDGKADVVSGAGTSTGLIVNIAGIDGALAPPITIDTGIRGATPYFADVDGDGTVDLVALGPTTVTVFLGLDMSKRVDSPIASDGFPVAASLGDVDGDGKLDLVHVDSTTAIRVCRGSGGGHFAIACDLVGPGAEDIALAIGDVNGDGLPDVVSVGASLDVFPQIPDKTPPAFSAPQSTAAPLGVTSLVLADMNGDGLLDIVVGTASPSSTNAVAVALSGKAGPGAFVVVPDTQNLGQNRIVVADLNGDGAPDVLSFTGSAYRNLGDGSLAPPIQLVGIGASVVADFDADGKNDIAVLESVFAFYRGHGDFTLDTAQTFGEIPWEVGPAIAYDVNQDGKMDVVAVDTNGSVTFRFVAVSP